MPALDLHATFHIGDDVADPRLKAFDEHNERVLSALRSGRNGSSVWLS